VKHTSTIPVNVSNYVKADTSAVFAYMKSNCTGKQPVMQYDPVNSTEFYNDSEGGAQVKFDLSKYCLVLNDQRAIQTPFWQLVRYQPSVGYFQLVQKRSLSGETMIDDSLRQDLYIEQVAANKPIYVDETVLRGFTTPNSDRYFYGPSNTDSSLYIAKMNEFALVSDTQAVAPFIMPSKIPEDLARYLR
jgi:hypothetical protein